VGILKKWLSGDDDVFANDISGDEYYDLKPEEALQENDGQSKMILLEPRAYSESQQIAIRTTSLCGITTNRRSLKNEKYSSS